MREIWPSAETLGLGRLGRNPARAGSNLGGDMNSDEQHQAELEAARYERAQAILLWALEHGMPPVMLDDLRVELGLATGARITVGWPDGEF